MEQSPRVEAAISYQERLSLDRRQALGTGGTGHWYRYRLPTDRSVLTGAVCAAREPVYVPSAIGPGSLLCVCVSFAPNLAVSKSIPPPYVDMYRGAFLNMTYSYTVACAPKYTKPERLQAVSGAPRTHLGPIQQPAAAQLMHCERKLMSLTSTRCASSCVHRGSAACVVGTMSYMSAAQCRRSSRNMHRSTAEARRARADSLRVSRRMGQLRPIAAIGGAGGPRLGPRPRARMRRANN